MIVEDLKICMTGDASINALVTGGIYFDSTPVGADKTKNWVVYDFQRTGCENTLNQKDAIVYYDLEVQTISLCLESVINISNALKEYLITYDDGKIRDISLINEDKVDQNDETKLFFKTDIYSILYEPE